MKRILLALITAGAAISAHAVPIPFEFSGGSISATGAFAISDYTPNSGSALLDDGQSQGFTFGTVEVLGAGAGELTVSVQFIDPTNQDVDVAGPYAVIASFFFNDGEWSGGSTTFDYIYGGYAGTAELNFDPIDERTFFSWPSFDFTGTITNLGSVAVAVPEPGALSLLGLGLIGLAFTQRRLRAR